MSNVVAEAGLNQIPVGYKQTEVGVIPEDWSISPLRDLLKENPKYGINAPAVPLDGKLPVYIRITDISEDGYFKPSEKVGVKSLFSSQYQLTNGDIVLARTGASVGKSYLYKEYDGVLVYAGFLIKVSPNKSILEPRFLSQYFQTQRYWSWVNVNSMRSGQPGINGNEYGSLLVPYPKIEEQTAIANALSDVDALITELEKLIAKQQAIKTATMQQLLTGRTRLPQFALREDGSKKGTKQSELGEIPEDWNIFCFSDCGYFQSGSGFPTKYQGEQEGDYPFFKVSDMNNIGNENILRSSNNYISENIRNLIAAKIIPINAIIFAKIGAAIFLERKKICFQPSCIDNNLMAYIVNNDKLYYKYAYLLFKNINLGHLVETTALPSLSSCNIGQKKVAVPAMEEQTAIATILSDMDEEIQALEQRLSKTCLIKQGMMQELLTGRTRLV